MRKRSCVFQSFLRQARVAAFSLPLVLLASLVPGCAANDGTSDGAPEADGETDATDQALASANLLRNGFFEAPLGEPTTWLGRWFPWADYNAPATRTTAAAWGGSYGIRIADPTTNALSCVGQGTDIGTISPGGRYRVWAAARRRSGSGTQHMQITFYAADWTFLKEVYVSAGTGAAWHPVTMTVNAPARASRAAVGFGDCTRDVAAATYDWDSVSLRTIY